MKKIICSLILIFVFALVISSVVNPRDLIARQTDEKVDLIPTSTPIPSPCKPVSETDGKNKIILRVSDVQGWAWRDTTIKMINDAVNKEIPVTASVIPTGVKNDEILVNFLKHNLCNIEIAQQGSYVSDGPEFKNMGVNEVRSRTAEGKETLEILFGTKVVTMVPPYNWYNWRTLQGFKEAGIKTVSVEGTLGLFQGVNSYNFYKRELLEPKKVAQNCKGAWSRNKHCVVIVYPAYFDEEIYQKYIELLDELKSVPNVSFTTFTKIIDL